MGTSTTPDGLYKPTPGEHGWGAAVNASTDVVQARLSTLATLAVNVKSYGATGDGATDDTAAVNAAIAALPANGATLTFPAGTYLINTATLSSPPTGTKVSGAGRNATQVKTTAGTHDLWSLASGINKITFQSLTFSVYSGGGHIFAPVGSVNTANFLDVVCVQNNPAKSIWSHPDAGYLDSIWLGCVLTHNGATSVPAFDFRAMTGSRVNSNTWQRCQVNNDATSTAYFFDFATSSASDYNYDNTWRDITGEINNGGFCRGLTANGFLFDNVNLYDQTTTVADLFYFGAGAGGVASRGVTFRRVGRRGGTLGGGLSDVKLQSAKAIGFAFQNCNTATGSGFTVDLTNNAKATAIGCSGVTFNNPAATFSRDHAYPLTSVTGEATVANTTNETALLTYTINSDALAVGTAYAVKLFGKTDNIATSGTLTFRLRLGGLSGSVLFTRIVSTSAGANSALPWYFDGMVTCRTVGGGGTVSGGGFMRHEMSATQSANGPASIAAATTSALALVWTAQWATADVANIAYLEQGVVTVLKP